MIEEFIFFEKLKYSQKRSRFNSIWFYPMKLEYFFASDWSVLFEMSGLCFFNFSGFEKMEVTEEQQKPIEKCLVLEICHTYTSLQIQIIASILEEGRYFTVDSLKTYLRLNNQTTQESKINEITGKKTKKENKEELCYSNKLLIKKKGIASGMIYGALLECPLCGGKLRLKNRRLICPGAFDSEKSEVLSCNFFSEDEKSHRIEYFYYF